MVQIIGREARKWIVSQTKTGKKLELSRGILAVKSRININTSGEFQLARKAAQSPSSTTCGSNSTSRAGSLADETDKSTLRSTRAARFRTKELLRATEVAKTENAWTVFPVYTATREKVQDARAKEEKNLGMKKYRSVLDGQISEKMKRKEQQKLLDQSFHVENMKRVQEEICREQEKAERMRTRETELKTMRAQQLQTKRDILRRLKEKNAEEERKRIALIRKEEQMQTELALQQKELEKRERAQEREENDRIRARKAMEEKLRLEEDKRQMIAYNKKLAVEDERRRERLEKVKQRQSEIANQHQSTTGRQLAEKNRNEQDRLKKHFETYKNEQERLVTQKQEKLQREQEERFKTLREQREYAAKRREEEKKEKRRIRRQYELEQEAFLRDKQEEEKRSIEQRKSYCDDLASQIELRKRHEAKRLAMTDHELSLNEPLLLEVQQFARTHGDLLSEYECQRNTRAGRIVPRAARTTIRL